MEQETFTVGVNKGEEETLLQLVYMGEAVADGAIRDKDKKQLFLNIVEKIFKQYICYKKKILPEKVKPRQISDLRDRQGDIADSYIRMFEFEPLIKYLVQQQENNKKVLDELGE